MRASGRRQDGKAIQRLLRGGTGINKTAATVGVGTATVQRVRAEMGLLVAQGSSALEFVMRSRAELWPAVPVIFAAVDEETAARLNLPSDMTGTIYQLPFPNMVAAAQALVPNLKRIALVGDPWERQAFRRHYQEEIPPSPLNSSSSILSACL